jgi:hypothetical protein
MAHARPSFFMRDPMIGWRVQWRWLGAAAFGVAATLGACVIEGGPGPTATELYAVIDAHCRNATTCACAWTVEDEDACTPELEARWKARLSEAQRRDLRYDAACFAGLVAQIDERGCYWPDPGGELPLCDSFCAPFHGDRAEGEDCEGEDVLVSDCAQGLVCSEGACTSPCVALSGRRDGEPCGNEQQGAYDDCATGSWCNWSGFCERVAEAGDPCSDGNCGEGLYCDWQTNLCTPPGGEGESCFEVPCAEGLACDWQTNTCTAAPGEGEPCYDLPCADDLYCDYTKDGAYCRSYAAAGEDCSQRPCEELLWCNDASRCVPAPEEGQPCLFDSICAEGSVCDSGSLVCVAPPPEGQPCASGTCAEGSWCDVAMDPMGVGICAPLRANDEMCSGHRQCQSNYCPNGFCWALPLEGDGCEGAGVCAGGLVCNGTTCEPTLTRAPAACSYPGW